jgi:hypothetical protein
LARFDSAPGDRRELECQMLEYARQRAHRTEDPRPLGLIGRLHLEAEICSEAIEWRTSSSHGLAVSTVGACNTSRPPVLINRRWQGFDHGVRKLQHSTGFLLQILDVLTVLQVPTHDAKVLLLPSETAARVVARRITGSQETRSTSRPTGNDIGMRPVLNGGHPRQSALKRESRQESVVHCARRPRTA